MLTVVQARSHVARERFARPQFERLVVYLAIFCGMRRGEISGLRWKMVDLEAGTIRIRESRSRHDGLKGTKTAAGARDVPMPPALVDELVAWRAGHPPRDDDAAVLFNRYGRAIEPYELARKYWTPIAEAADLRRADGSLFGMNALRHSAASLWIMGGLPDFALKKMLGHSSVATTKDIYGHLFPEDGAQRQAVLYAARAVFAPQPRMIEADALPHPGEIPATGVRLDPATI